MEEQWKYYPGSVRTEVSNMGNIKVDGNPYNLGDHPVGYLVARVDKRVKKTVHSMVMETWVGPRPQGSVIDHINEDKKDNRLENLRYLEPSKNSHSETSQPRVCRSKGASPLTKKPVRCLGTGRIFETYAEAECWASGHSTPKARNLGKLMKAGKPYMGHLFEPLYPDGGCHLICVDTSNGLEFPTIVAAARSVGVTGSAVRYQMLLPGLNSCGGHVFEMKDRRTGKILTKSELAAMLSPGKVV